MEEEGKVEEQEIITSLQEEEYDGKIQLDHSVEDDDEDNDTVTYLHSS